MEGARTTFGTVFEILASGKERVLYNFADHGDGYYPVASLINVKGTLYGNNFRRRTRLHRLRL